MYNNSLKKHSVGTGIYMERDKSFLLYINDVLLFSLDLHHKGTCRRNEIVRRYTPIKNRSHNFITVTHNNLYRFTFFFIDLKKP